ncbi:hypothetical protein HN51_015799, partial [Arachis hypogaea]
MSALSLRCWSLVPILRLLTNKVVHRIIHCCYAVLRRPRQISSLLKKGEQWVQVCFRPTASIGLDETELAIAVYLYGNHLTDNYEEDIVFSEFTARRDAFRSLLPGKPIVYLVLDLVADMMRIELTRESGYWFLPTTFALSEKTKLDPDRLPSCITYVYLGKVDCLKRVFIAVFETTDEGHEH